MKGLYWLSQDSESDQPSKTIPTLSLPKIHPIVRSGIMHLPIIVLMKKMTRNTEQSVIRTVMSPSAMLVIELCHFLNTTDISLTTVKSSRRSAPSA